MGGRVVKFFGLGLVLILMIWAAGNSKQVLLVQIDCTVVTPEQSIQQAVDEAVEGAVICLSAGSWEESIVIEKSLTLRGAGQEKTVITAKPDFIETFTIRSPEKEATREIQVVIEDLTAASTAGAFSSSEGVIKVERHVEVALNRVAVFGGTSGVRAMGAARVTLLNSLISRNGILEASVWADGEAQVTLSDSTISGGSAYGVLLAESAQARLYHVAISGNMVGLSITDSAQGILVDTGLFENGYGLAAEGSARLTLFNSEISRSQFSGILAKESAQVELLLSTLEDNGRDESCSQAAPAPWALCSGLEVRGSVQVTLINSEIAVNADWGLAAWLKQCGYDQDDFGGRVTLWGDNTIEDNNTTSNERQGNICLPAAEPKS